MKLDKGARSLEIIYLIMKLVECGCNPHEIPLQRDYLTIHGITIFSFE